MGVGILPDWEGTDARRCAAQLSSAIISVSLSTSIGGFGKSCWDGSTGGDQLSEPESDGVMVGGGI